MRQALTRNGLAAAEQPEATRRSKSQRAAAGAELHRPNTRPIGEPNRGSYPFGALPCRIYRPARSVMQAGADRGRSRVLEFEPRGRRWIEPLMGWTATDNPFAQIRLTFQTLAAAMGYAEREGLSYRIVEPHAPVRCQTKPSPGAPGSSPVPNRMQCKVKLRRLPHELRFPDSLAGEIASPGHAG